MTDNDTGYCQLAEKCRCAGKVINECNQWVPKGKPPLHHVGAPQFEDHPPYMGPPMPVARPTRPLPDDVVLPKHYSRFQIEPIHFSRANELSGLELNFIKYALRAPYKHEDMRIDYSKAVRCIVMECKFRLGDPDWWKPYKTGIAEALAEEFSYDKR